jgi:gamma-glutamylcyclotransferase (GGCT)/AIG2-like uncharacterized protein YtfP
MSAFHLFVYGTLRARSRAATLLRHCERVGTGTVKGTLYDIDGAFPALMLYGDTVVRGEVWRCPAATLLTLDEYEGVNEGLFRRIAVTAAMTSQPASELACWCYVAGPALSRQLTPERRIGAWPPAAAHG